VALPLGISHSDVNPQSIGPARTGAAGQYIGGISKGVSSGALLAAAAAVVLLALLMTRRRRGG